jgi:Na+/proline symporter
MAMYAEGVYSLVEQASAFGSAGIFVVVVFGLFSKRGHSASAIAALLTGVIVWIVGSYILELPWAYLAALGSSLVAYVATALFDSAPFQEATA